MRLIDADKIGLTDFEIISCNGDYKAALQMRMDVERNRPEVVRCRDCQNRYEYLFCGHMGDNDFCSAGQPRKDGADNE